MDEKTYKLSFLRRQYVDVTLLKMLNPAKFILKEAPSVRGSEAAKAFRNFEEAMDMYYNTYQMEISELPCSGSIVAVCPDRRSWYRAKVESILETTSGPCILAYLLDYGKTVNVDKFDVRKPFPKVHDVPFQALEFQLYDIVPCSLIMQSDCKMTYGQSKQWDVAAEEFVKATVSSRRCAQMKVVHVDNHGTLYGDLLVSIDEELVSLSEELVKRQFAVTVSKAEMAQQTCKKETMPSDSAITTEDYFHFQAGKLKKEQRNESVEVSNAEISERNKSQVVDESKNDSQVKSVGPRQVALLKKLQWHLSRQDVESQPLNQRKCHVHGLEHNKSEISNTKSTVNLTKGDESEAFSTMNGESDVILSNESQATKLKTATKTEGIVDTKNKQTSLYRTPICNTIGVNLLQRLQAKLDCIQTGFGDKSYKNLIQNEYCSSKESRDLRDKTSPFLKVSNSNCTENNFTADNASKSSDKVENSCQSEPCALRRIESAKVSYETCQGKSHHLQLILQKTLRKPKQELQRTTCQIEKSSESIQSNSNTTVYPNILDSIPSSKNVPLCKNNDIVAETPHSNPLALNLKSCSSEKAHIFNKLLNQLNDSSKEAAKMEKSILLNNKENLQTNSENRSSVSCSADTERNNQSVLPNSSYSIISKQHLSSLETNTSLTNSKFTVNKIKPVEQMKQNGGVCDAQASIMDSVRISPKHKLVSAHFKTTMDKWEDTLWDSNKMLQPICYGKSKPRPVKTIASAGFNSSIVQSLKEMHFQGPLPVQTMIWPSILRGLSVVTVAPAHSGKTFGYLLPLLSHISEPSLYEGLPISSGPKALMLCSSWRKAQTLYDHCKIVLDKCTQVKIVVAYGGGEKHQMPLLVNGCDILITTPPSLLRLLHNDEYKVINLKRCCHLIIDDGDTVLDLFKEEIVEVIKEYGICLQNRKHLAVPNQIIVCCEHWRNNISSFARHCMPEPLILIASPFEAAVYARIYTYCHFVPKPQSYSALGNIIDSCSGKKVVICTSDDSNAKIIYQFLQNMSICAVLILSSTFHYEVNSLINEWNSMLSPNTAHVLIVTDDVLLDTGVSNANCLVQCNLESTSRIDFGLRYSCLMENYYSVEQNSEKASSCTCHILLTEKCVNIAPGLVNLLQNLPLKIPQKLHLMAEERRKQFEANNIDLCYYVKAYGHCPNKIMCKERHSVSECEGITELPKRGKVRVHVCYVIDATHYYARIIEHSDPSSKCMLSPSSYLDINLKLLEYYHTEENRMAEDEVTVGKICVVERPGSTYHRVRIEEIVNFNSLGLPWRVKLHYLDDGWREVDDALKLLKIPPELAEYPIQVIEVYICNVQPVDKCFEWTLQASRYTCEMIEKKEMTGIIVLTLGHTLWLDPFVHYVQIDKSNIVIKESNVRTALIKEGFAVANDSHIEKLRVLCNGIITLPPKYQETKPITNSNVQHAFLELNKDHLVYVYGVQSPDIFFIQRHDRVDLIDNMQKELQELHKKHKLEKLKNLQKGVICVAPFKEDNNYYRARIEDTGSSDGSDDDVSLFFVDFGDRDFAKKSDLYCIPEECLLLPFQAIECSLGGITAPSGGWNDAISDKFDSLTITSDDVRKPLYLKVLKKEPSVYTGGHHYVVKLWEEGCDLCSLSEELVNQGMAISTGMPDLSETSDDVGTCDDNLTDEETEMVLALSGALHLKKSLDKVFSKRKSENTLNKLQNNISHKFDAMQKQEVKLSLEYNDIPPLEKCAVGYIIPQVLWWQKKGFVKISIQLVGIKNYDTVIAEKHILFSTRINGKLYRFEEDLFDSIDPDNSKKSIIGQYVELTLMKLKEGVKWPRLTSSLKKKPYIRTNFDYLDESSSDDEPSKIVKNDPKEIVHFHQSDEEYSTDDDEAWIDSQYKDNFYHI